jgi:hypothetical protein
MSTTPGGIGSARRRHPRADIAALCLIALCLSGCANTVSYGPQLTDSAGNPLSSLIPNKALQISPGLSLSMENIVLIALIDWAVEPLAPNWQLAQAPLGAERVRISLRKKRFTSGGDGEAAQLFARRAEKLAREGGYALYTVLEYTEGIESALPIAQRVAQGVIELKR